MPTIKNIRRGQRAKLNGKLFENKLKFICEKEGVACTRIPDACLPIGRSKFIRKKSPFDFVIGKNKTVIFLDCKYREKDSFSFSEINYDQLEHLNQWHSSGFVSGYLIAFKPSDKVCFFFTPTLFYLKPKSSLTPDMGLSLGTVSEFSLQRLFE